MFVFNDKVGDDEEGEGELYDGGCEQVGAVYKEVDALVHAVGVGHGGGVVDVEEAPWDLEEEQTEEE